MSALYKLVLPKHRNMGDEKCKIHLDAMQEIYIIAILSPKFARGKSPLPIRDHGKTEFKVGDVVFLRNHTPTNAFDTKYKTSFRILKEFLTKLWTYRIAQGRSNKYPYNIYNYYILWNMYGHIYLT